jgi:hypothetical protein
MKRLLLLFAVLVGCSSSSSVDCERIAAHEFELTIEAMPAPMQERARTRLQSDRRAIAGRCQDEAPSSGQARCMLAATDLAALRRCGGE